ncbi:MAG: terminase family protein [Planctomycetes bacterium]|nr:terminase family protein [Planctomycetota bacterium]
MAHAREVTPRRIDKRQLFHDLGFVPHEGQWAVHASLANRRICACGVRWGKTICAALEGIAAALEPKPRSIGWVVAPTYDLADKVFREIVFIVSEKLRHRVIAIKESERRVLLHNLGGGVSEIRAKSADNPVSLLGEGLDWLIVDEASRLKPSIWEGHLSQRLIDKRGWALLISTPKGKGWFFDLFQRGQGLDADYESWNHPSWTNPHLDREVIEAERARLPERVFGQEYGAQFVEGAGQVFRGVREVATGSWEEPDSGVQYYAGLDLAKITDYTVLVIITSDRRVVHVDRFHRIDWALQVERIKSSCERYGSASVLVDSTGPGEPVFESLMAAGVWGQGYTFTNRSKSDLINNLALMIERGEIVLPRADLWPVGIDELDAFEYSVTDAGSVRTNAPGGMHDDCVVALALAAWQVQPHRREPRLRWV